MKKKQLIIIFHSLFFINRNIKWSLQWMPNKSAWQCTSSLYYIFENIHQLRDLLPKTRYIWKTEQLQKIFYINYETFYPRPDIYGKRNNFKKSFSSTFQLLLRLQNNLFWDYSFLRLFSITKTLELIRHVGLKGMKKETTFAARFLHWHPVLEAGKTTIKSSILEKCQKICSLKFSCSEFES